MSKTADSFDEPDCVCSFGMKLTWDINDPKLPQEIKHFDAFQEWTDGYVRFIYSSEDKNAQRHLSGWAMRNTNNHNCQILKKSCLGVVLCTRNCSLPDGTRVQLRPAICDKARQKQQKKLCPSCNSVLELVPCRGHSGYPVTNFWRLEGKVIFFQAKGVHDHPKPENKTETEARRSAVKRRLSSPYFMQRRRPMDPEPGIHHEPSGPFSNLHPMPCMEGTERFGIIQPQHYPSFQSPEASKFPFDPHAAGEATSQLQKTANHQLYMAHPPCGYDFTLPGYLGAGSYKAIYKEPGSPQLQSDSGRGYTSLAGTHNGTSPPAAHEWSYDALGKHPGWKQILAKGVCSERGDFGQLPAAARHPYYNSQYPPCTYGGPNSTGTTTPSLQTIITTTTKVSYQPCKPSVVREYTPTLYDCNSIMDGGSPDTLSDLKVQEETGVIKLAYQQEALSSKVERVEPIDSYRYGNYSSNNYPDRVAHSFRYEEY